MRFLVGTDAATRFVLPGFDVHEELRILVEEVGLTPLQAIQAASRNSAESLGKLRDLGTIEVGKIADLVLIDADPLKNVRATSSVVAVIANGQVYKRSDLDALLAQIERQGRSDEARTSSRAAKKNTPRSSCSEPFEPFEDRRGGPPQRECVRTVIEMPSLLNKSGGRWMASIPMAQCTKSGHRWSIAHNVIVVGSASLSFPTFLNREDQCQSDVLASPLSS